MKLLEDVYFSIEYMYWEFESILAAGHRTLYKNSNRI